MFWPPGKQQITVASMLSASTKRKCIMFHCKATFSPLFFFRGNIFSTKLERHVKIKHKRRVKSSGFDKSNGRRFLIQSKHVQNAGAWLTALSDCSAKRNQTTPAMCDRRIRFIQPAQTATARSTSSGVGRTRLASRARRQKRLKTTEKAARRIDANNAANRKSRERRR